MSDDDPATLWCGNLAEQVTEELLYDLFLQAGPLEKVRIARDKQGRNRNFAFITFRHEVSVPYAIHLFRGTSLFHKALSLRSRGNIVELPPPIRCTSLGPAYEPPMIEDNSYFNGSSRNETLPYITVHDQLTVASLQGNWSHRSHPYRNHDRKYEREYDSRSRRSEKRSGWRDRDRKKDYDSRNKNLNSHQRFK